jgi:hypothetical protein
MSSSYYRGQVRQHTAKLQRLRPKHTQATQKVSKLNKDITTLAKQSRSTRSESSQRRIAGRIESKERDLVRAQADVAKLVDEINTTEGKLADAQSKLAAAEAKEADQEGKKHEREERARQRRAETDRRRREREERRKEQHRIADDNARDRKLGAVESHAADLERRLEEAERRAAPPEIVALILASSPEDQEPLRLDKETREIQKRLRAADFPGSIYFEWRPARQLPDLIQDLNEVRPQILHFSGHSDGKALLFEDAAGDATELSNDLLDRLLSAAGQGVRLAIFNSCESAAQAERTAKHIDIAIGMETTIADDHAKTFAAQFYNSLAFGHSVATAFDQAKVAIELEHGGEVTFPRLFAGDGVNPELVVLVNPDPTAEDVA